jgi:hypothetical protein
MTDRPTKAEICDQIRLYAAETGRTPGKGSFLKFSGISEASVTYYWPRWTDAVREAGFAPLAVPQRIDEDDILAHLAKITTELGHFPTINEYKILARGRADLPAEITVRKRFGSAENWRAQLRSFAHASEDYSSVLKLLDTPRRRTKTNKEKTVNGYVYLRKLPGRFKIGRTTSVPKREQQHQTKTWEKQGLVHVIETDDPEGIEDYWKRRFKDKNKKLVDGRQKEVTPTEEYYLTDEDVAAFCRRTYQ